MGLCQSGASAALDELSEREYWIQHENAKITRAKREFKTTSRKRPITKEALQWQHQLYAHEDGSVPSNKWEELGGDELTPALKAGAIALLDAQWLVNFAYGNTPEQQTQKKTKKASNENPMPAVLARRQDLPPKAFVSLEELIQSADNMRQLHVLCLSYMWLTPTHPDPQGTTLQLVAQWLQTSFQFKPVLTRPVYGIFWDFASLYQRPRTTQQDALFRQGVDALSTLFSHPHTVCCQVTQFPPGYPAGYNLPANGTANCAPYHERGWPLFENAIISLSKASNKTNHDICADATADDDTKNKELMKTKNAGAADSTSAPITHRRGRAAPVSPDKFWLQLQTVSFTNAKDDRPLVRKLYETEFRKRFAETTSLGYNGLGWDDHQIVALAQDVIGAGCCPQLVSLNLSGNAFEVVGCQALAAALQAPRNASGLGGPFLEYLSLSQEVPTLGDDGVAALAVVLVQIPFVDMENVGLGAQGCRTLVEAVDAVSSSSGEYALKDVKLEHLRLSKNRNLGDEGFAALTKLFWVPTLREIEVADCSIGDPGHQALSQAILDPQNYSENEWRLLRIALHPGFSVQGKEWIESALAESSRKFPLKKGGFDIQPIDTSDKSGMSLLVAL